MRDDIIVDMANPTPLDLYRFSSKGLVRIYFSKNSSTKYSIEIKDDSTDDIVLDDICNNLVQLWNIVEILRKKARSESKTVDVYDVDCRTSYKKITLATTLDKEERAKALERQIKRTKSVRRRMVVDNKYHSRKGRVVTPRVLRPILREEKTW
jgi:hypothetical protein